ncbi:uncharacterized protein DUF4331 [Motilibacter peucedani]|uniref:Uncharacterized protein DUF4331 n=1 Tax=Motilibacter peucedani TaxID=598650 RepID=A0A420XP18_9ACTN|nr:DUF4331 domain-containing protein [Motilibacter peucedani]RKS73938.1 uncharacterized protein DUF4331 [Motilibacter peucedani]
MTRPHRQRARATALIGAGALLATTGFATLAASPASASSHREAPLIAGMPQDDATDTYAFRSPDKPDTVTLLGNWLPFQDPSGGPNFYPWDDNAAYDLNIDNNGDAKADITYRFTFVGKYKNPGTFLYNTGQVTDKNDPDLNYTQRYIVRKIENGKSSVVVREGFTAPSYVGAASMPNYWTLRGQARHSMPGGGLAFAGQADDPFFADLRVFDLLYGGNLSEVGHDTLNGYNVNTLGVQVPISEVTKGGEPVIGVWTSTIKKNASGKWVSVSRLGNPLVNEVVIPSKDKDAFNASSPSGDGQFLNYVTKPELPTLLQAIYGLKAPATPRNDLVSVFLTGVKGLNQPANVVPGEELRLNTSTPVTASPNRLGVLGGDLQGFPNGRRLGDDVLDISLQAVAGELVGSPNDLGDGVNANDKAFDTAFPYVAAPNSGSTVRPGPSGMTSLLSGGKPDGSPSGPGSSLPVGVAGLGLLTLVAGGALALTARRRQSAPAAA